MNAITITDEQRAELNGVDSANEVRDAAGKLVGYLVTPERYAELQAAFEEADIAELDRRSQEPGGKTLSEIWKELGVE